MQDLLSVPCWFLGTNAPKGYYSRFDKIFCVKSDGKVFLLKGGPGTGKSTMLKKIASVLAEKGLSTELVFCSADTDSLDAVITSDGKFAFADATLPHAYEPKYPGTTEIPVSLWDCWDEKKLWKEKEEIIRLFDENRRLHEEARRYISAASGLLDQAAKLGLDSVFPEKVEKTAKRICIREFGRKNSRRGTEKQRFLSAITDKGIFFHKNTPKILCDKIYLIDDDAGAVSRIFMSTVRKYALEHGLDIITCTCPIFPQEKIEHIFIPALRLGFMTDNRRHKIDIVPYRIIHARRFADFKKYSANKIKIRFALRSAKNLIDQAVNCTKEAKLVHNELEKIYINATDFKKVDEKFEKIIKSI